MASSKNFILPSAPAHSRNADVEFSSLSAPLKVLRVLNDVATENRNFLKMSNGNWQFAEQIRDIRIDEKKAWVARFSTDAEYSVIRSKAISRFMGVVRDSKLENVELPGALDTDLPQQYALRSRGLGWDPASKSARMWMEASLKRAKKEGWLDSDDFSEKLALEMAIYPKKDPHWPIIAAYCRLNFVVGAVVDKYFVPNSALAHEDAKAGAILMAETNKRSLSAMGQLEMAQRIILRSEGVTDSEIPTAIKLYDGLDRPDIMLSSRLLGPVYAGITGVKQFLLDQQRQIKGQKIDAETALENTARARDVFNFVNDIRTLLSDAVNEGRETLSTPRERLHTPAGLMSSMHLSFVQLGTASRREDEKQRGIYRC